MGEELVSIKRKYFAEFGSRIYAELFRLIISYGILCGKVQFNNS